LHDDFLPAPWNYFGSRRFVMTFSNTKLKLKFFIIFRCFLKMNNTLTPFYLIIQLRIITSIKNQIFFFKYYVDAVCSHIRKGQNGISNITKTGHSF
jgi:hypothetical protein